MIDKTIEDISNLNFEYDTKKYKEKMIVKVNVTIYNNRTLIQIVKKINKDMKKKIIKQIESILKNRTFRLKNKESINFSLKINFSR